jgi:L-2-hydroxyglutarate oxidase
VNETSPPVDVTIVGGGLVGLATAQAILAAGYTDSVRVLEKEDGLALHQSTHNSGVLHAGLAYVPGSAKARLAREGIRRMTAFCVHHHIPHELCGKLVVAVDESERPRLEDLFLRGKRNGLKGLRRLGPVEAREIEPEVRCVAAIHVPEEGIVSFRGVADALAEGIRRGGGDLRTGCALVDARREGGWWHLGTTRGVLRSRVIVNCAGLFADEVARLCGATPSVRVLPFRGEYHRLRPERAGLVRHLIYPVARPGFPFLGVHLTRRIDGAIDAGPNAVLAFAREGYRRRDVVPRDLVRAVGFPGLWRFVRRHRRMVTEELMQSLVPGRFASALQRLVPALRPDDLVPGHSGVRAQAVTRGGALVEDFLWEEAPGAVHVLNAPSPAATASLAIGDEVARRAASTLAATRR